MDTDDEVRLSELLDKVEKENMKEYSINEQETFEHQLMKDGKLPTGGGSVVASRIPLMIGAVALALVLILIVILQSVTIAHLNLLPVVCPETTTDTTTFDSSTDSQTGTTAPPSVNEGSDSSDALNMQLLSQMAYIVNMTRSILLVSKEHSNNNTQWLSQISDNTQGSPQKLVEIVNALSSLKETSIGTEVISNDILLIVEELLNLQNDSFIFSSHLPVSCQDIKNRQPNSPSGYYHINSEIMYCEMGELCGYDGGWTRLAYLDMSDSTVDCPTGFNLFQGGGVRACGRPNNGPSCVSVKHQANGISYSEVCGKVVGYQYGAANAVDTRFTSSAIHNDINSYYVDGVSITRGYPRQHIWTLMGGIREAGYNDGNCPCNSPPGSTQEIQSFVGDDYYCESGNPSTPAIKFYPNDPLWDGEDCGSQELKCCDPPNMPWFYKTLNSTADYLELRVCGDQASILNEDVPINYYEIYVK